MKILKPSTEKFLSEFFFAQEKFFDCGNIFLVIALNIYFEVEEFKFEWDEEKAEKNWQKHKIRFETAAYVFLDENKIEEFDEIHSEDEDRYKIIGRVGKILAVIYTERGENYRIISARYATKKEVNDYYAGNYDT